MQPQLLRAVHSNELIELLTVGASLGTPHGLCAHSSCGTQSVIVCSESDKIAFWVRTLCPAV